MATASLGTVEMPREIRRIVAEAVAMLNYHDTLEVEDRTDLACILRAVADYQEVLAKEGGSNIRILRR